MSLLATMMNASQCNASLANYWFCSQEFYNFPGNQRFRILVDMNVERYSLAETKSDKTRIVCQIVQMIREAGGGFCRLEKDGSWYEVGDAVAREKVGSLFRDCLSGMYRSSSRAKTAVRRQRRARNHQHKSSGLIGKKSMGSSSGSITDTTVDSSSGSDRSESLGGQRQDENYGYSHPDKQKNAYQPMDIKEVRFSLLEQDLEPLLDDFDCDFDDITALDFV